MISANRQGLYFWSSNILCGKDVTRNWHTFLASKSLYFLFGRKFVCWLRYTQNKTRISFYALACTDCEMSKKKTLCLVWYLWSLIFQRVLSSLQTIFSQYYTNTIFRSGWLSQTIAHMQKTVKYINKLN